MIAAVQAGAKTAGQHIALVKDSGGGAYAFALSTRGTLMYAYQSAKGPGGWSDFATLPGSPADLVSAPAAVADQNGHLEVFVRDARGQVVDGWQDSAASGGWRWDGALTGTALPGTPAGNPGAVLLPNGRAAVFTRLSNGSVVTAQQRAANGTTGWSGWSELGGNLAGNPIPYDDPNGGVDLFARSTAGTLVADYSGGGAWGGWSTVPGSPTDLAADPTPAANADKQIEVFTTTSAGGMDSAWSSSPGSGSWTWGVPLTGDSLGSALVGTPGVLSWADGHLEISARMANGELAHAWQNAPNGVTDWSLWGVLPGSPAGYPASFVNGDGTPEVLMLGPSSQVQFVFWLGSAWSAPVVMPGTF